jgi:hypothetical protein
MMIHAIASEFRDIALRFARSEFLAGTIIKMKRANRLIFGKESLIFKQGNGPKTASISYFNGKST